MNLRSRFRIPLWALGVSYSLLATFCFSTAAAAASSSDLHTFYGVVKAVDLAAKTLTLKSGGKSFVFRVTSETKINGPRGYASLDKIRPGYGGAVVMRVGDAGTGIAVVIQFDPAAGSSDYLASYSARTTSGQTVSGIAFNNYVVSEPPTDGWMTGITYELKHASMFVLSVRPDGTVSDVRALQTLGYPELDARAAKWFMKWRFRPNSVTEVRMPLRYFEYRHY